MKKEKNIMIILLIDKVVIFKIIIDNQIMWINRWNWNWINFKRLLVLRVNLFKQIKLADMIWFSKSVLIKYSAFYRINWLTVKTLINFYAIKPAYELWIFIIYVF